MSEDPFRSYFEHSIDAMVIADDQGNYVDVNQAACDLFGFSRQQMLDMSVGDLLTAQGPGAAEQYQTYLHTSRETGEFTFLRTDKQVRTASYSACRIADNRHLSVLRDITPQKQSSLLLQLRTEALRDSELRGRLALQCAKMGSWERDLNTNELDVSPQCKANFGLALDAPCTYETLCEMIHPDDRDRVRQAMKQAIENYDDFNADYRICWPDGSVHWISAHGTALYDTGNAPIRIIGVTQNVTERMYIESERERLMIQVEAERARLQIVLEQMPAGVFLAEAPAGNVLFANEEAERIYDVPNAVSVSIEEWTNWKAYRPDGSLMLPKDYPLARAIATGETTQDEVYMVERGDGSRKTLSVNAGPIRDRNGKTVAGVVAFYDISERTEHIREIETLNERLKRSILETHHRVKNNLQIISALAELQIEEGNASVPLSALKRIGQHAGSLAALHDLLTQQAKVNLNIDTISSQEMMDRLFMLLDTTTGGRRIRYEVADVLLPVQDGTSIALLVSELISNAVKHGKGDIELTFEVNDGVAHLEVCDDGPGFPEGFDPKVAANTGFSLIEATGGYELGGAVSYDNRREGGARVAVTFPI